MCMIDGADEPFSAYQAVTRQARKPWECSECLRTIDPGEVYERVGALWESRWQTYLTCRHCVRARTWLTLVCDGWLHLGVHEDLKDHLDEFPSWWLRLAVSGMDAGWESKTGKRWPLVPLPKPWLLGVPGLVQKVSERTVDSWRTHWRLWDYRLYPSGQQLHEGQYAARPWRP